MGRPDGFTYAIFGNVSFIPIVQWIEPNSNLYLHAFRRTITTLTARYTFSD